MTIDDEVRTFQIGLETTRNGVTVEAPWVQRQANGAVIVRLHIRSPHHQAGELLLNETDVIALDPDERPLRTQVRRVWGYAVLADVTPAHMETARFDVGFRLDLASSRGFCGLSIALLRAFNPAEGPRAIGGPWVFKFRVADDAEIAEAVRAEAARQQAAREEAARQEAARLEAARLAAERREAIQIERTRAETARSDEQEADGGQPRLDAPRPERRPGDRLPRREWEAERARAAQLRAEAEARARPGGEPQPAQDATVRPAALEAAVANEASADAADSAQAESGTPAAEGAGAREGRGSRRRGGRFLRPEQAGSDRDEDAAIAAGAQADATSSQDAAVPESQDATAADATASGTRRSGRRGQRSGSVTESEASPSEAAPEQQSDKPAVRTRRVRVKPAGNEETTQSSA
jgi:hypothetical protein